MRKFLTLILTLSITLLAGCTTATTTSEIEEVDSEYSDEEVVVESDEGYDPDEQRLLEGNGYMMTVVDSYTMPATEADANATADTILKDSTGEPYKIVDHIGPDTVQK